MIYELIIILIVLTLILIYKNKLILTKKLIYNIFIGIIMTILIILIINYIMIIGPYDVMKIAHDNDWISFWGSLLGGIFGGIATLLVIVVTSQDNNKNLISTIKANKINLEKTLEHSTEQFLESKKNSEEYYFDESLKRVRPYIAIDIVNVLEVEGELKHSLLFSHIDESEFSIHPVVGIIELSNIGLGSAINIGFETFSESSSLRCNGLFHREGKTFVNSYIYIKQDESIRIKIKMPKFESPYSNFEISIQFSDLYKNRWEQIVYLVLLEDNSLAIRNVNPPKPNYINRVLTTSESK